MEKRFSAKEGGMDFANLDVEEFKFWLLDVAHKYKVQHGLLMGEAGALRAVNGLIDDLILEASIEAHQAAEVRYGG